MNDPQHSASEPQPFLALDRTGARKAVSLANGRFYIYLLLRPDGTAFYVGKGKGQRVFFHETEAFGEGRSHKLNIIRSIRKSGRALGYSILAFFESEQECHAREVAEIRRIGRHDLKTGPLANLTAGGEGTSGLSDETRSRIDRDLHGTDALGERGVANRFFLQLCSTVRSVPVRPANGFTPKRLTSHRSIRRPTARMAAALVASAIANRVLLVPECVIPRRLYIDGVEIYIENGVGADILRAGLAELVPGNTPGDECFRLRERQLVELLRLSDASLLLDAGILEPSS